MFTNYNSKRNESPLCNTLLLSLMIFFCFFLISCSKTTESSDQLSSPPLVESQVIEFEVESIIMDRNMPCMIYLPKGYNCDETYPVWYGLHGYSSDETMWIDYGVAEHADALIEADTIEPMIMVFPFVRDATLKEIEKDLADDGDFDERKIDQFICTELIPYIDANYYTKATGDNRYIGGFSMGGMIALRIAFHHTDMFTKTGGFSAAVISSDYSGNQLEEWLYPNDNFDTVDIAVFDIEKKFSNLTVYLDAGQVNDPFTVGLQSLYDALQKRGVTSELHVHEGGHTLLDENIDSYLGFFFKK